MIHVALRMMLCLIWLTCTQMFGAAAGSNTMIRPISPIRTACVSYDDQSTDGSDYYRLVNGVSSIVCLGVPGPVFGISPDWVAIAGGDEDTSQPSVFVMARAYGRGRVLLVGHDGMLSSGAMPMIDNSAFMSNVVQWLNISTGNIVRYSTGHREWATGEPLRQVITNDGFIISPLSAPISSDILTNCSVLIIGNAWGDFTTNEIEHVRQYVENGGGLLMAGLGWSWASYHTDKTMEDYPMTKMASPYHARWLTPYIIDPTHQLSNSTAVFHTFYPEVVAPTIDAAMDTISNAHHVYGSSLPSIVETNITLQTAMAAAHAYLAIPAVEMPASDPLRTNVFCFYKTMMQIWPNAYTRTTRINEASYPRTVWMRERVWSTMADCLPLTDDRRHEMADVAQLGNLVREIFMDFGVILLDNCRLSTNQLIYIHQTLSMIPPALHNLRRISVGEFLGTHPPNITLSGLSGGVNTFGVSIGSDGWIENSFPPDVAPGWIKGFCGALVHEVNHVVDSHIVKTLMPDKREALIDRAGTNSMNYLRSMLPSGFFTSAPQEFFASIANEWFTDSAKTIELGIRRFNSGYKEPINQALFFADVYSLDSSITYFFFTHTNGYLLRFTTPLLRGAEDRVAGLHLSDKCYSFTYDADGYVSAMGLGPFIDITNAYVSVANDLTSVTIGGTNSLLMNVTNMVVSTMWWTNTLNGMHDCFATAQEWTIDNIPLDIGTNVICVFGTNEFGLIGFDSIIVTKDLPEGACAVAVTLVLASIARRKRQNKLIAVSRRN